MLVLIVGPKGSGKSHIGRLLHGSFGVHYIDLEPYWLGAMKEQAAGGPLAILASLLSLHEAGQRLVVRRP